MGVSCVNALSTYLRAEVHRNGKAYMQEYSCGKPTSELQIIGDSDHTGTMITFKPDDSIFTVTEYDYNTLANRLRDLAFLNAGITLVLTDMRATGDNGEPRRERFYSANGLREFSGIYRRQQGIAHQRRDPPQHRAPGHTGGRWP